VLVAGGSTAEPSAEDEFMFVAIAIAIVIAVVYD
jgi:hypothetical protein